MIGHFKGRVRVAGPAGAQKRRRSEKLQRNGRRGAFRLAVSAGWQLPSYRHWETGPVLSDEYILKEWLAGP